MDRPGVVGRKMVVWAKEKDNRIINMRKYDAPVLKIPPYTKTKSQNAARYRVASEWNELNHDTRAIETHQKFQISINSGKSKSHHTLAKSVTGQFSFHPIKSSS